MRALSLWPKLVIASLVAALIIGSAMLGNASTQIATTRSRPSRDVSPTALVMQVATSTRQGHELASSLDDLSFQRVAVAQEAVSQVQIVAPVRDSFGALDVDALTYLRSLTSWASHSFSADGVDAEDIATAHAFDRRLAALNPSRFLVFNATRELHWRLCGEVPPQWLTREALQNSVPWTVLTEALKPWTSGNVENKARMLNELLSNPETSWSCGSEGVTRIHH